MQEAFEWAPVMQPIWKSLALAPGPDYDWHQSPNMDADRLHESPRPITPNNMQVFQYPARDHAWGTGHPHLV